MRKHRGDVDWIRSALENYGSSLTRYALSLVGDLDQARDIVQETFLALCRQEPDRICDHLAEWLFKVCRNRAMEARRRRGRMQIVNEIPNDSIDRRRWPSAILEQKETLEQVIKVLDGLPAPQQEVIRLKFHHELSYKEISAVTGLSVTNVGFLIHTAVASIRRGLPSDTLPVMNEIRRVK